jgi:hypothetical protein
MPEDKKEPMIDVGEEEGAEINLDQNNEQIKEPVAEERIEVEQVDEQPVEAQPEEKKSEKDDELKEYSEGVQKRIAKLTRKMREAERQKEEAIAYAHAEKQRREEYEKRYSKLDQSYVSEFETRVKTNMEAARASLRNAIESGDVDAQVAAQEQIARLNADATKLSVLKSAHEEQKQEKQVNITPQQYKEVNTYNGYEMPEGVRTDAKAEAWAAKNSWFGNNSAMTYTAFDIHKKLVEEEGFDPQSDEYYSEIDKRIRLEFPNKFDKVESNSTEERARPSQTVASAKRPSATGRRKTVKLTPSQVAIAKRLGVPLEEYAKQLTAKEA